MALASDPASEVQAFRAFAVPALEIPAQPFQAALYLAFVAAFRTAVAGRGRNRGEMTGASSASASLAVRQAQVGLLPLFWTFRRPSLISRDRPPSLQLLFSPLICWPFPPQTDEPTRDWIATSD